MQGDAVAVFSHSEAKALTSFLCVDRVDSRVPTWISLTAGLLAGATIGLLF